MPPQVDEFLLQQHPQSDIERRVNQLSSTVYALRHQVSNLQIEMQKMTQIAEQSQSNQRVTELSSTVEELRRQLSNMQNEMQQQKARHAKENWLWKEMSKRRTQQQTSSSDTTQQRSSGRVPDWLRQKILEERRSQIIRRELNQYNSTSNPTSSDSNADNQKKCSQLASHLLQDTSKNQQKPSSSSDGGESLQQDCPPKVSNPWAHWTSPVTMNTSDEKQDEKPKIDQASNYSCETNPYVQSMMAGLEENKRVLRQASKNPKKKKFLSMTEDEQQQTNLNLQKAVDAMSIAFLDGVKIWNDSLKAASERNRTDSHQNIKKE